MLQSMDIFIVVAVLVLQRKQTRTWNTAFLSRYTNEQALASGVHNDYKRLRPFKFYYLSLCDREAVMQKNTIPAIIFLHEL